MGFSGLINNSINWSVPTWDLFIIFIFIVGSFVYGLTLGKGRLVIILISIYISLALINYFPYQEFNLVQFEFGELFIFKIIAFFGLTMLIFFLFSRSSISSVFRASKDYSGTWLQILLFSFFHVGLLVSAIFLFLPEESLAFFSPATRAVFNSQIGRFFWMLTPVIFMAFLKKRRKIIK